MTAITTKLLLHANWPRFETNLMGVNSALQMLQLLLGSFAAFDFSENLSAGSEDIVGCVHGEIATTERSNGEGSALGRRRST